MRAAGGPAARDAARAGPTGHHLGLARRGRVDWVRVPLRDGSSFTTYGRQPAVQVLVPRAYAPEPLTLPVLSTVVEQLPQGARRCT